MVRTKWRMKRLRELVIENFWGSNSIVTTGRTRFRTACPTRKVCTTSYACSIGYLGCVSDTSSNPPVGLTLRLALSLELDLWPWRLSEDGRRIAGPAPEHTNPFRPPIGNKRRHESWISDSRKEREYCHRHSSPLFLHSRQYREGSDVPWRTVHHIRQTWDCPFGNLWFPSIPASWISVHPPADHSGVCTKWCISFSLPSENTLHLGNVQNDWVYGKQIDVGSVCCKCLTQRVTGLQ